MKHLFTLAALALCAAVSTTTVQAQQPAAKPAAPAPKAAAPKPTVSATTTAKPKAAASKFTAEQIKEVQTALQKQKLYTGKINGVWGASTVKAYKAWEKANSLPQDGVLTDEAIAKLKTA